MSPILGIIASSISGSKAITSSYESIATSTVGSGGTGTITFNSIPSTFKHLQIRIFAQTNRGTYGIDEGSMRFNSDSNQNYAYHFLYGDGSAPSAIGAPNETKIPTGTGSLGTTTGGTFGINIIDILDYASTNKNKTVRVLAGADHNGLVGGIGGRVGLSSGVWMNSGSAISTITITPAQSSLFSQYSSFALYGIKG
jgi:hypothetical protein